MPDDIPDEVPVEIKDTPETAVAEPDPKPQDPAALLEEERRRSAHYEDQFKRALADFQNLRRKIHGDIESEVSRRFDRFMLDLLEIFDDFERARDTYRENQVDTSGLDSIIKNIGALLSRYHVVPVPAVGMRFDPNLHEAVSFSDDADAQEDTVTRELRRGYTSGDRLIRPALVEISRKSE